MSKSFDKIPSSARVSPSPLEISFPEDQIADLKTLVKLSKTAPPTYEGAQPDRRLGITTAWLTSMKEKWATDFDWRKCEARLNSFPQFTTTVENIKVHFTGLFSEKENAVPILLLHGWPGSILEFLPLLQLFKDEFTPETLPYHFIVPSLPGYFLSSGPPVDKDFTTQDIARVVDQLMKDLGFERGYVTQGGDIGSRVSRILGVDHDSCKAVHLNFNLMQRPDGFSDDVLTASEKSGLARGSAFMSHGRAYAFEHGTRPSTIGHILSTNPVALLSWCGEKFLDWVDEPLPDETILEFVSLYWLTETFPRSIYTYREYYQGQRYDMTSRWYINKPFGFSYFPMELLPVPKSWVDTTGNLVFWKQHEKGGHFAALERPGQMKADISEFVNQVWPTTN